MKYVQHLHFTREWTKIRITKSGYPEFSQIYKKKLALFLGSYTCMKRQQIYKQWKNQGTKESDYPFYSLLDTAAAAACIKTMLS